MKRNNSLIINQCFYLVEKWENWEPVRVYLEENKFSVEESNLIIEGLKLFYVEQ